MEVTGICPARGPLVQAHVIPAGAAACTECGRDFARRRSAWTWAWLAWLLLFLAIELPAAVRERGEPRGKAWKTLSRHVWRWFPTWPRRAVFSSFWLALGAHFVFGASALWLLTAVPLVGVIVYAEFFERPR